MQERRERPKEIYNQAVAEGRDPEDALKEYLLSLEDAEGESDTDGEHEEGVGDSKKGKKRKRPSNTSRNLEAMLTPAGHQPNDAQQVTKKRQSYTMCAAKQCMNLLDPKVTVWRT